MQCMSLYKKDLLNMSFGVSAFDLKGKFMHSNSENRALWDIKGLLPFSFLSITFCKTKPNNEHHIYVNTIGIYGSTRSCKMDG